MFWFTRTYRLYAEFQNVAGLSEGATVRVGGIHKGTRQKATEARSAVREYLVQHFKLEDTRLRTFGGGKPAEGPDGGVLEVLVYGEGK